MKNFKYKKYLMAFLLMFAVNFGYSQMMEPGDPGNNPEAGGDPLGGGAPIGGGVGILLTLGAAYGGKKVYQLFKEEKEEMDD